MNYNDYQNKRKAEIEALRAGREKPIDKNLEKKVEEKKAEE